MRNQTFGEKGGWRFLETFQLTIPLSLTGESRGGPRGWGGRGGGGKDGDNFTHPRNFGLTTNFSLILQPRETFSITLYAYNTPPNRKKEK